MKKKLKVLALVASMACAVIVLLKIVCDYQLTELLAPRQDMVRPVTIKWLDRIADDSLYSFPFEVKYSGVYSVSIYFYDLSHTNPKSIGHLSGPQQAFELLVQSRTDTICVGEFGWLRTKPGVTGGTVAKFRVPQDLQKRREAHCRLAVHSLSDRLTDLEVAIMLEIKRMSSLMR